MDNPDTVERFAWTRIERKSGEYYLPYINARIEGDCVRVSVRGEEIEEGKCGPEATIMVPRDQFAAIAALTTPADGLEEELARAIEWTAGKCPNAPYVPVKLETARAILTALRAAQPTERGAIVAWLRAKADDFENAIEWSPVGKDLYSYWAEGHTQAADAIERGDHLVAHETASGDTQAGLCSTDDRQADTPARPLQPAAPARHLYINPGDMTACMVCNRDFADLIHTNGENADTPATASRDAGEAMIGVFGNPNSTWGDAIFATPPEPSGQSDADFGLHGKYHRALLDLLAAIHRDGGHTTEANGLDLSIEQAMQKSSERIAASKEADNGR